MTLSSTMPMLLALAVSGIVAGPLGAQYWRDVAVAPSDACCIPATAVAIPYGYLAAVTGTAVGGLLGLADRDRWRAVWPERR